MTALADASRAALSEDGALAKDIPAFVPRPAQQRLAAAVAEAFGTRGTLLAEAGTGTGKTYAYLVPALLSGLKTIVSTGTRALQDQLYHRDLPRVRDALGTGLKTALLKGRANYLCRYRMEQAKGEPAFNSREMANQFQRVVAWSGRTRMGDLAEIEGLAEDTPLLPMVTSTADNCLGSECPFWTECFVVQARQRAQAADLVVVNHHLLLADLALKQEGFGEILPGAQAFVVDEAHQLPDLAAQFFGEAMGARAVAELSRDALRECSGVDGALAVVQAPAQRLEQALRSTRAAMDVLPGRGTLARALEVPEVGAALGSLAGALDDLASAIDPLREAAPGLDACHARARDFAARLGRWMGPDVEADGPDDAVAQAVRWYELSSRGFRLQATPLDVSGPLRMHREQSRASWVFTSATLAVAGGFDHLAERLGLDAPATLLEPSPFDWGTQALCYLPPRMPEPGSREFAGALVDALWPVLEASGGRAFVLFASHRALREVAAALRDAPWPLFVQGEAPRHVLLEQFRASGNGVLLGAASFREGVDVAGDALSVVVIDKLPFAAPDDPVFEARLQAVRRRGGNPFRDEQLPQAVIALKQGVGRLIRTEADRGVLVLCDPRLTGRSYGRTFLDSLPPFPRTRDIGDVEAFFAAVPCTA
ncbi:MAG TPA: ATP-dependent DNA helicase [Xanthomonadaceae bacterium]|nr:ATP-dependent DNA helicase [Xanthomonadaceae bacterium]